jgi:hypothetical protein
MAIQKRFGISSTKNGFNKPVAEAQQLYEIAFRLAKTARAAADA